MVVNDGLGIGVAQSSAFQIDLHYLIIFLFFKFISSGAELGRDQCSSEP